MKKIIFILLISLILVSCTNKDKDIDSNVDVEDVDNSEVENNKENDKDDKISDEYFTGEIILNDLIKKDNSNLNYIFTYIPDMESEEKIKDDFSDNNLNGDYQLVYFEYETIKDLPRNTGIYKVKLKLTFDNEKNSLVSDEIYLSNEIGTIKYNGKVYDNNSYDYNIKVKDRVGDLIVQNVVKYEDIEGIIVDFAGSVEVEGFYNLYYNGLDGKNVGRIVIDESYLEKMPKYKGEISNDGIYFSEIDEIYSILQNHSLIGRIKCEVFGYRQVHNIGMGRAHSNVISEIKVLDDKYKGLFPFEKDMYSSIEAVRDDYIIVGTYKNTDESGASNNNSEPYYFVDTNTYEKVLINESNDYRYFLEKTNNLDEYVLIAEGSYSQKSKNHTIKLNVNNNGQEVYIRKSMPYLIAKNGNIDIKLFQGDKFLDVTVDSVHSEYDIYKDRSELVRLTAQFKGEITLSGKLMTYDDSEFGYKSYFIVDEKSKEKLPISMEELNDKSIGFIFENDNIKDLLGGEIMEKDCEITIDNYKIHRAETEAINSAKLVKIN